MKYGKIDLGQIEAAINIIGGEKGLIDLLRGKLTVVPREKELPVWTTIKVGTGLRNLEDVLQAFESNNKHMSNSLRRTLMEQGFQFQANETEQEIDLCVDTVFNLTGLSRSPIYNIHNCIREAGGMLCDTEIAFQLRLQDGCIDTTQEDYFIAMEGVWIGRSREHKRQVMFFVNNRKSDTPPVSPLRLDSWAGGSGEYLDGEKKVVFVKQRPTASDLYHSKGTFTGCQRIIDSALAQKKIWKEGGVLHVSLTIFNTPCPACSLGASVDRIRFFVEDLKRFFKVTEVVFHHTRNDSEYTFFDATNVQHTNDSCDSYPEIKGIGMRWEVTIIGE